MGISKASASNSTQGRTSAPVKSGPSSRQQMNKGEGYCNRGTQVSIGIKKEGK